MCPVAGEQEESSGVVDVFEPLAGLLCTLTPQAHLWGLLRPAGSLSEGCWQISATRRKRFTIFNKSQHNRPFFRLAKGNAFKLLAAVMWAPSCFLSHSLQAGVWARLKMP